MCLYDSGKENTLFKWDGQCVKTCYVLPKMAQYISILLMEI